MTRTTDVTTPQQADAPLAEDRTFRGATADALADSVAAFHLGLIARGMPEEFARELTQEYLFASLPSQHTED